jgi:hypothetical protein
MILIFPGVCVDAGGNIIVADCGNHKIRRILPNGITQTIAGTVQGMIIHHYIFIILSFFDSHEI